MANINFNFSIKQSTINNIKTSFTYKDIGTSKLILTYDNKSGKQQINDLNTSLIDKDAIKNSLNNILHSRNGDSILLPEFGVGQLYEFLYSPIDKYSSQKIIKIIKTLIETWEPRIEISSIPIQHDDNTIIITINYYIPSLMINDSFNFSFEK